MTALVAPLVHRTLTKYIEIMFEFFSQHAFIALFMVYAVMDGLKEITDKICNAWKETRCVTEEVEEEDDEEVSDPERVEKTVQPGGQV